MSFLSYPNESQEGLHGSRSTCTPDEHATPVENHTLSGRMARDIHLCETVFEILKEGLFQDAKELHMTDESKVAIVVKHPTLDKWFEFSSEDLGIMELFRKYYSVHDIECEGTNGPVEGWEGWGNEPSKNKRRILKAKRLLKCPKNSTNMSKKN